MNETRFIPASAGNTTVEIAIVREMSVYPR
ncbi:hypothetical protein Y077_18265 [Salmonella enterica subsp. enterica serovar Infantis str. CVM N29304]|nr:hypothetical protein Y077_18265 [Salmonella enterica subsp. enterica serovar Infantis str. CVM N29304]